MKKILAFLFCFTVFFGISAAQTIFEAESATLSGAVAVSSPTASGGAYVDLREGTINMPISISQPGYYSFVLVGRTADLKHNYFVLNGHTAKFAMYPAQQMQRVPVAADVYLDAGTHNIGVRPSWGYVNIDYIEMVQVQAPPKDRLKRELCAQNPIPEADALFSFMLDNYGKKIISGVMTLASMDMPQWLLANTGKEPAMLGIDFMHCNRGYNWHNDNTPRNDAETWYSRNGIPALMWHWRDPSRVTEEFYVNQTDFDLASALADKNGAIFQQIIGDIDFVAQELLYLQNKGVPVLWRPLHEAAGQWFWWGASGPEALKELWIILYDRLVEHHKLRNIIWVWTAEAGEDPAWYPGNEYVDIVGIDIYKDGDHSSQLLEFNNLNARFNYEKIIAESECGSFPDPDNLVADTAAWSFFMPWYGEFVTQASYNPLALWQKTMAHEYVITLDQMPNLREYQSFPADNSQLKSISLSAGVLSAAFSPDITQYELRIADGQNQPVITAAPMHRDASVSVVYTPVGAAITVTSKDNSSQTVYNIVFSSYLPAASALTLSPPAADLLAGETLQLAAKLYDQYGAEMQAAISWSATGGSFSTAQGSATTYTAPQADGTYIVTASAGGLSKYAQISVSTGYSYLVPDPASWIIFNAWDDQDNGSELKAGADDMNIVHRQWGYGNLWLLNEAEKIPLEKDQEYEISFMYKDGAGAMLSALSAGFATTRTVQEVTASAAPVHIVEAQLSATGYTEVKFRVKASLTAETNMYFLLSWGAAPEDNKPTVEYSAFIKNIKIRPFKEGAVQEIELQAGWNLVSTYISAADKSVAATLPCADIVKTDIAFYSTAQPAYLNSLEEILPGRGYLVHSQTGCTAKIEGSAAGLMQAALSAGWNLVGLPVSVPVSLSSLPAVASGNEIQAVKDFSSFWNSTGHGQLEQLVPGSAYFIYSDIPAAINFPAAQ
jgi:mannan endo-1,4-beta-mannosidase